VFDRYTNFGYLCKKPLAMSKNTSITLGNHFEDFIQNRISTGRYKNASEVIRAGLRLLEEEEDKVTALRQAIQEGIDSGIAEVFEPEEFLKNLKAQRSSNG
jgi:antitoxin ParD1/3/4